MTNAVVLAQAGSNNVTMRNRIINGGMVIDQRNAGAEVNPAVNGAYYLDRWKAISTSAGKFKIGQNAGSVTPPTGFKNYLGVTSLSAYSVGASDVFTVTQYVEVSNAYDLAWGTANAQAVTLSFRVYSSLTGTFGGSIHEYQNGYPSYPFTYTISAANTWTTISITIPGPTVGTWQTTNNTGLFGVSFGLGVGSTYSGTANTWATSSFYYSATGATSVVGTNGATFYITGVQLEKGTTATPFEQRLYGTELQLAQRYYEKSFDMTVAPANGLTATSNSLHLNITCYTTSNGWCSSIFYKTTKRAIPTVTLYNTSATTGGFWGWYASGAWSNFTSQTIDYSTDGGFSAIGNSSASFTNNTTYVVAGAWAASAEL